MSVNFGKSVSGSVMRVLEKVGVNLSNFDQFGHFTVHLVC
jgi:hypothetical protein